MTRYKVDPPSTFFLIPLIICILFSFFLYCGLIALYHKHDNYVITPSSSFFKHLLEIKETKLPLSNKAIKDKLADGKIIRKEYDEIISVYNNERNKELMKKLTND